MLTKGSINEQLEGLNRKGNVKDKFLRDITIAPGIIPMQIWLCKLLVNNNVKGSK